MWSDADGSVSFNGLYLAGSEILLTHTHTHTQGTRRNFILIKPFLRAREACRKPLQTKGSCELPLFALSYPFASSDKWEISTI